MPLWKQIDVVLLQVLGSRHSLLNVGWAVVIIFDGVECCISDLFEGLEEHHKWFKLGRQTELKAVKFVQNFLDASSL